LFQKHFSRPGYGYTDDAADLLAYYRAYRAMMAAWHEAFPGFVLDVDVGALMADREAGMRRILDFLGLTWHPACAGPFQSEPQLDPEGRGPPDPVARLAPYREMFGGVNGEW